MAKRVRNLTFFKPGMRKGRARDEYFLNALMGNIPDVIYFKDRESQFVRISRSMADKFKLADPSSAINKTDYDFYKFNHSQQAYDDEQEIIRTGVPIIEKEEMETWFDRPPTWVSTTKMPLIDNHGNIIGTFGISRDITEKKRMEEAIEKRIIALTRPLRKEGPVTFEELFDLADFQRMQDEFSAATGVASITTRPDGTPLTKPSGFTRFCNDIVRKTEKGCANCYKSDAYLGAPHPAGPLVRPCLSGGLLDAGASIIVGGHHIANWMIGQVRDETQTDDAIRDYAGEINVDEEMLLEAFHEVPSMSRTQFGHIVQWLYTIASQLSTSAFQNVQQARFITEQKEAEKALQKSEALLRETNAAKDKFFSIIAHDLKNPFNCIVGFCNLLEEKTSKGEFEKVGDFAINIKRASNQAIALLINLLEWSRSQTGRMPFTPEKLDFSVLIHEVTYLLEECARNKSISLLFELPDKLEVVADKDMIGTILRNLISNAIKFTHPKGTVVVSVEIKPDKWIVQVRDNGIGIRQQDVLKIFRIEDNYSTKGTGNEEGTGLGLILCKEFVEKHGGTIWVESEWGKGSSFYFSIPKR